MRNKQIKIQCVFQDSEKTVSGIFAESFRLFLVRVLAEKYGNAAYR